MNLNSILSRANTKQQFEAGGKDFYNNSKGSNYLILMHFPCNLYLRFDSDGKVTFVCDLCPDQSPFYDLLEFFLHKKNVHWKPTTCQPCNKTYASMRSYDQHILSNVHAKTVGPKALAALERKKCVYFLMWSVNCKIKVWPNFSFKGNSSAANVTRSTLPSPCSLAIFEPPIILLPTFVKLVGNAVEIWSG